ERMRVAGHRVDEETQEVARIVPLPRLPRPGVGRRRRASREEPRALESEEIRADVFGRAREKRAGPGRRVAGGCGRGFEGPAELDAQLVTGGARRFELDRRQLLERRLP